MTERTYLDWNATARLGNEAHAALLAALAHGGNPSSVHAEGRAARHIVEAAREKVALLVGARPRNVVFTAGGTEANVLALSPGTGRNLGPRVRLLVSAIEHPSVLAGGRFPNEAVETIPVTSEGIVDLAALKRRLAELVAEDTRALVSLMHANNETGVVQPVCAAAQAVHEASGLLHTDAVQTVGRLRSEISAIGADVMTLSGHKIGAPKGVGALIRRDESIALDPVVTGGGQEGGTRAGTENVAGIAGFGAAAAAVLASFEVDAARMQLLRDRLEAGLKALTPDAVIFGSAVERLPNTTLFSVPGIKAETAVIAFDLEGVAVSSGAACSSGKVAASHVLAAMGVPATLARGAVRVSLGPTTTQRDIDRFLQAWNIVSGALLNKPDGIAA